MTPERFLAIAELALLVGAGEACGRLVAGLVPWASRRCAAAADAGGADGAAPATAAAPPAKLPPLLGMLLAGVALRAIAAALVAAIPAAWGAALRKVRAGERGSARP